MNRGDTARCYALVCAAYGMAPSEASIEAWRITSPLMAAAALEAGGAPEARV